MGLLRNLFSKRRRVPVYVNRPERPVGEVAYEVTHQQNDTMEEDAKCNIGTFLGDIKTKSQKEREAKEIMNELRNLLEDTNEKLNRMQECVEKVDSSVNHSQKAVEDKVHSEAVKIYRNVQAVLVDLERKVATKEEMNREIQTLKNYLKGLTGITAITLILLVFYMLFSIGVF